jgi:hypothetical protein
VNRCSHHRDGLKFGYKTEHSARDGIPMRDYRVVVVGVDGGRTEVSRHRSFIAAERVRLSLPTIEACEIRIESIPVDSLQSAR